MEKQVIIKVDENLKKQTQKILIDINSNMSELINNYLKLFVEENNGIPN